MVDNSKNETFPAFSPISYVISLIFLFVFGVLFNKFTAWLICAGKERGNTWALVIIGVIVTVFPSRQFVGHKNLWRIAGLFAASGSPMVAGAMSRYVSGEKENTAASRKLEAITSKILNS